MSWLKQLMHRLFIKTFESIFRPEEFENYKIAEEATITFCMRELRAILNFAESMNISVSANFEGPGKYALNIQYAMENGVFESESLNSKYILILNIVFDRPVVFVIKKLRYI